jgi:conjugative relaxase-like TrwC/TraI family protein
VSASAGVARFWKVRGAVVAIGIQKLSAGSGYEYLTRQVAAMDVTGRGHSTLSDYYSARGESPGHWYGGGLAGVGLAAGDEVTREQMKLLFGAGLNPVTGERLGQRYAVYANDPTRFEIELGRLLAAWSDEHHAPLPQSVRDRLRTDLAREWFTLQFGRAPSGPRELHGFIVKATSHPRTSVAGFDLTFTPPKSVSALWAVADPRLAAAIRAAHDAAVAAAMMAAERRAVFTRQGHDGIRHVEVRGLIAAVFVHRDSRAGDPNLHTHLAIANKVQTLSGEWLALDAQVLYRAKVSLSEEYTTQLQARLTDLGLSFVATGRDGKRPVYEIAGVDPRLIARWSSRRSQITARTAELVAQFQEDHERPPTPVEKLALAQQATLDTRQAKHLPRSESEQRATWQIQAERVLGPGELGRMLITVLSQPRPAPATVDQKFVTLVAERVIAIVESERSSWTEFHVRSEALRQVRAAGVALDQSDQAVDRIVAHALSPQWSMPIVTRRAMPVEPAALRRRDGQSVYATPAATQYTSQRILWAERRLIDIAGRGGGRTVDANSVTFALLQSLANHEPLNTGQQLLVHEMATSGRRLQLAIAPAGTGKTTAMRALATAWISSGGNVLGLAPSAAAAEELRSHLHDGTTRVVADNLAKQVWAIGHQEPLADVVGPGTLVIIDEAGMADTLTLDHVVTWCLDQGASVRLIGDDQQLGAIGAGGVLRDIAATHGALRLDTVMRFTDPAEAAATLALRTGDSGALGFYLDHDRIHVVDPDTATRSLLTAWQADRAAGLDALMLAPTRAQVAELNHAARTARLGDTQPEREIILADGNPASEGDVVITRRNNRTLTTSATAWVRNGDRWTITLVRPDGALDVQNLKTHAQITLPAEYVTSSVELGYATTIHAAQGVTADTCHGLLTGAESRQVAYTMLSRGRTANHAWIQVSDVDHHTAPTAQPLLQPFTATQLLEAVIGRDEAPVSVTTLRAQADDPVRLLGPAVSCYLDAIGFAADRTVSRATKHSIDEAGQILGLTQADAWPTLRSHLLQIAANGHDPTKALGQAYGYEGSLATARDPVAVIDYRLDLTRDASRTSGPLPWLPGIPTQLLNNPEWGPYLNARYTLTEELGSQTLDAVSDQTPGWARDLPDLDPSLVDDIRLWRAAHNTPDTDLRPTGPIRWATPERRAQRDLDDRLEIAEASIREWTPRIIDTIPTLASDPRLPVLATKLATLDQTGYDADRILQTAAQKGPLPDDHPADALGYRITHLAERMTPASSSWEIYDVTPEIADHLAHPERYELPHSPRPSDRSPGIGR